MADQTVTGGPLHLARAGTSPLAVKVEELSGEKLYTCYQCGKCAAGCLFAEDMDLLPNQVLRLIQLGDAAVLAARAPWVCASCLACAVRCPRGVDIAKVMEGLRLLALRQRKVAPEVDLRQLAQPGLPQIAVVGAARKLTP
ncbi:MAG: 4Fe-4S dicluster domain-containing protein [Candidatus Bipolaricaulaceae bacterium]